MPPIGSGSPVPARASRTGLGVHPVRARGGRELIGARDGVAELRLAPAHPHGVGGLVVEDALALDGGAPGHLDAEVVRLSICSNMSIAIWIESRSPRIRWARPNMSWNRWFVGSSSSPRVA